MTDSEFELIMRRQICSVLRLACSYLKCRAEAEDAAQEVFLRLYRSPVSFETEKDERAWLLTVTANICKNILRSPRIKGRCEADISALVTEDISDSEKAALEAVMKLPEKYRTPVHLFYCEGYSVKEISQVTGIKESTVRTRLQRARKLLRADMERD